MDDLGCSPRRSTRRQSSVVEARALHLLPARASAFAPMSGAEMMSGLKQKVVLHELWILLVANFLPLPARKRLVPPRRPAVVVRLKS